MAGNNTPCWIAGIGQFRIKMFDRMIRTLDAMRYIPYLKRNLMSLITLDSKGYMYTIEGKVLKVIK